MRPARRLLFILYVLIVPMCLGVSATTGVLYAGSAATTEEPAFMEMGDVFAASKHRESSGDAPASVTVVGAEDIEDYGYRSVADILRNTTGFSVANDRQYDYLTIRGIGRLGEHGNLVQVLMDGHNCNDNIYGYGAIDNGFGLDMDLVKRVEIVRGPGSALYGSDALMGVVNVVPKRGEDLNGGFVKAEGGSFDTYGGTAAYGKKFDGGLDLMCAVSGTSSGGRDFYFREFDSAATAHGRVYNADGSDALSGYFRAAYGEVSLTTDVSSRNKSDPTAPYGTIFGDDRLQLTDVRSFVEMKWDHPMDGGGDVAARLYYDRYTFTGRYPYDYPPIAMNRDESFGQWVGSEVGYSRKLFESHFMSLGWEGTYHFNADQSNFDVAPYRLYLEDHRTFGTTAVSARDEWDIFSKLRLVGGGRYDYNTQFGDHFSPQTGAIFKPVDGTVLKLLYGESFRAPNAFELYYNDKGFTALDNPGLKPETLSAWELIWEQNLCSGWKGTLSGFYYGVDDLITGVAVTPGVIQYQNLKQVTSDGFEVGVETVRSGGIKGGLSYSFQNVVDETTGGRLAGSPRHVLKGRTVFPFFNEKVRFAVLGRYMSDRLAEDGAPLKDVFVTDLNLTVKNVVKGVDASVSVLNLFNVDYYDPVSSDHIQSGVLQNGRTLWFKAVYRF